MDRSFKKKRLDKLARETGFCKRKRKLTPKLFVEMLLYKTFSGSQESLLDHVRELQLFSGVNMTKQSIDERFSPAAVEFLKSLVADQLASNIDDCCDLLKVFSNVFIQDSTRFKLPDYFKDDYKGYGVKGMDSGGAIQLCFDLRNHKFASVEFTAATNNDSLKSTGNSWIEKKSLVLRDLGYYKIEGLKEIVDKGAFYISKAKPRSNFYKKEGEKLDIKKLAYELEKKGLNYTSLDLFIDRNERLPTRVIFCKVPQEVYEKRVKKKGAKGKSRGWKMTEEYRIWCSMNIFVTNIPETILSDKQIINTYRLRWQIELVFKTWKSHYRIHQIKKTKKVRAEVYIYSTLLLIIVHWRIFSWLQRQWKTYRAYVSLYKFSKYMIQISSHFSTAVILKKHTLDSFIKKFLLVDKGFFEKEKRNKKLCFSDILQT